MWTLFAGVTFAAAQRDAASSPAPQSEFEVVSIHRANPHRINDQENGRGLFSMSSFPTNRLTINNSPLAFLVQIAYNIDSQEHLSAMPSWMESQEYDFSAKADGDQQLTLEQMRPLLQHLLEQRFHLASHQEIKFMSGFALVLAKGGSKLQSSTGDGKPFAQLLPNRIDVKHMDGEHIAGVLAHRAGQPIVDETGLVGNYDFRLSFASLDDATSNLPDFFIALQQQLGLKLESRRVPVDFLVIDHVDKIPTDN